MPYDSLMSRFKNILKHIKNRTVTKRILECINPPPSAMTWAEFNLIKSIIKIEKPNRCLEWGSGYSTKSFSKLVAKWDGSWTTIEHDWDWYKKALKTRALVRHIKPNNLDWTGDGTYEDFANYVEFPQGKYDFVMIDGRARIACIERALSFTDTIILHDAPRYNVKGWTIIGRIGIYSRKGVR